MHSSTAAAAAAAASSPADPSSSRAAAEPNRSSSSSSSSQEQQPDKWENTLAVNHTLSSLYLKKDKVEPFQQLDLAARRRKRELAEMTAAAAKQGTSAEVIEANLGKLQQLVPGLAPNLDQMKASDWASILKDVDRVVALVICLKTAYPKVDIARLLQRMPKLLMKPLEQVQADAQQVKALLSRVQDIDAIIDAVPYLINPAEVQQSLANLARWFPNQDPFALLQSNPTLLVNIEEADLEADPLYGVSMVWF
ncbi:hypothetical protein OEZ86_008879 [Tetradesmus obliquus]|nr:hypothetical protein OEZ86_008879 [Tetradesmus obliquus]